MPSTCSHCLSLFYKKFIPVFALLLLAVSSPVQAASLTPVAGGGTIRISGDGSTVIYTNGTSLMGMPAAGGAASPLDSTNFSSLLSVTSDGSAFYSGTSRYYLYSQANGQSYNITGSIPNATRVWLMSPDGKAIIGENNWLAMGIWTTTGDWITGTSSVTNIDSTAGLNTPLSISSLNNGTWKLLTKYMMGDDPVVVASIRYSDGAIVSMAQDALADTTGFGTRSALISADGSTIAVLGSTSAGIWSGNTLQKLTALSQGTATSISELNGISGDGSVVVGAVQQNGAGNAAYWYGSGSSYSFSLLKSFLAANGVSFAAGDSLANVQSVSADGKIMVGEGTLGGSSSYYIANVTPGASGVITPGQLNQSLGGMRVLGPAVTGMGQLSMSRLGSVAGGQGLHAPVFAGRGGGDSGRGGSSGDELPGRLDVWGLGSLGTNYEMNGDDLGVHGGVGLSWDTGRQWRFGLGVFGDSRDLDTGWNGSQRIRAMGPGVFVVYSPERTGLEFRAAALWQSVDLHLKRGYANGAGTATSTGDADAEVLGLTGRVQWTRAVSDNFALTPFAEYAWQSMHVGGYSESGGPFPASFDARNDESNSVRLGLRGDVGLTANVGAWAWAAWDHRFEDKSSGLGGTVTGLGKFSYEGGKVDQDWGDAGVGVNWKVNDRLTMTSSLGAAIGCDDDTIPGVTASVGFNYQLW